MRILHPFHAMSAPDSMFLSCGCACTDRNLASTTLLTWCAPAISPGRSASTGRSCWVLCPPTMRVPKLGLSVVKGYAATSGDALQQARHRA